MENKWWFLKKHKLPYDSIILPLGMCPKELKVGTERGICRLCSQH